MKYGLEAMLAIAELPTLPRGVQARYEGSIDKLGGNADWDWWLYQDDRGEWVILDVQGPGCIYNFVQHRYLSSEEPVFRFYFDGEKSPRFEIRAGEFGLKHPFVEPLASRYVGPVDGGRGPIGVIRSFVPMAFQRGCRVTSSVRLEGFERARGEGGWGHVIYHLYDEAPGLVTFTGAENYTPLLTMLKNVGCDPKPRGDNRRLSRCGLRIEPGHAFELLAERGRGCVNAIRLRIRDFVPTALSDLWIRMRWDGHEQPDIELPIGCFFGDELGIGSAHHLMLGLNRDGAMYGYFPMPYWESAEITLYNAGNRPIVVEHSSIELGDGARYAADACGYFRASRYYARRHTPGADSIIADIAGRGRVVCATITCHGTRAGQVTCEGDVRVHIDGIRTPQIESDGSESYACYGWGFPTPPEANPFSGYDGLPDSPWSMTRTMLGDWYPFCTGLRFGIESGGNNDQYLEHSGAVLYYGLDQMAMRRTDTLDFADDRCIAAHAYRAEGGPGRITLTACFEGDDDHVERTFSGFAPTAYSEFSAQIDPANRGVRLRRRSDQREGPQSARVWIDGVELAERGWYFADRNPYKRWLEDELDIPRRYTAGKDHIRVRIEPTGLWNEYGYEIFSRYQ